MSPPPCTLFWPRNGTRPGAVAPDVTGQQRQVDERQDVVDRVVMLRDAERPAKLSTVRAAHRYAPASESRQPEPRSRARRTPACRARPPLDRHRIPRSTVDKRLVTQSGRDDLAPDGVGQRHVGPDVEPEPEISPLRRRGPPWIDHDELCPVADPLQHVMKVDRVCLTRIRAPENDEVGFLDLSIGTRPATRSKYCRQTDDTGSVSSAVTAIDVVGARLPAARTSARRS